MKIRNLIESARALALRAGRPASMHADRAGLAGLAVAFILVAGALAGALPPGALPLGVHVLLLGVAALVVARVIELAHLASGGAPARAMRPRLRGERHRGYGRHGARNARTGRERESA